MHSSLDVDVEEGPTKLDLPKEQPTGVLDVQGQGSLHHQSDHLQVRQQYYLAKL